MSLGEGLDAELAAIHKDLDSHSRRLTALESQEPPPPPPPPPPVDGRPNPLRERRVDNELALRIEMRAAAPGTHVILTKSITTAEPIVIKSIFGTTEHPVVLRGADDVSINVDGWMSSGIHGSALQLMGSDFWVSGLTIHGGSEPRGGRCLTIGDDRQAAKRAVVHQCTILNSWNHGLMLYGDDLRVIETTISGCCRRNESHMLGIWPYPAGTWHIDLPDGRVEPSRNVSFERCQMPHNFGDGLSLIFCEGGAITDCEIGDHLYSAISLHCARDIIVSKNRIYSTNPKLTKHGNAMRGVRMAVEKVNERQPHIPSVGNRFVNNVFDGGQEQEITYNHVSGSRRIKTTHGIRVAIMWVDHPGQPHGVRENYYSNIDIFDNNIRNVEDSPPYDFGKVPHDAKKPENCQTDVNREDFGVARADEDAWTFSERIRVHHGA